MHCRALMPGGYSYIHATCKNDLRSSPRHWEVVRNGGGRMDGVSLVMPLLLFQRALLWLMYGGVSAYMIQFTTMMLRSYVGSYVEVYYKDSFIVNSTSYTKGLIQIK